MRRETAESLVSAALTIIVLVAIVCSVVLLSGCGGDRNLPPVRVETVTVKPDPMLLKDCPVPAPQRDEGGAIVIGDAIYWSGDLLEALVQCNNDKRALRQFFEDVPTNG